MEMFRKYTVRCVRMQQTFRKIFDDGEYGILKLLAPILKRQIQGATKVLLRYKRQYRDEMSNNNSIHLKLLMFHIDLEIMFNK